MRDGSCRATRISSARSLSRWGTTSWHTPSRCFGTPPDSGRHTHHREKCRWARARLPLAYDRDLQEDKTALFATVDNTFDCLEAAAILVEHLEFDRQRLAAAAGDPSMLATDAAEELVRGGTAFRKAHQEVAGQVREGTFATSFNAKSSVAGRDLVGGPNQRRVAARARVVRREAVALRRWGQKRPTPLHER